MIAFVISCFLLALVYAAALKIYKLNGPSKQIGRFCYLSIYVYGFHLIAGLATLTWLLASHEVIRAAAVAAILVSPYAIARVFSFQKAALAMGLQMAVLIIGGLWLMVG